jgi:hypothetical protein
MEKKGVEAVVTGEGPRLKTNHLGSRRLVYYLRLQKRERCCKSGKVGTVESKLLLSASNCELSLSIIFVGLRNRNPPLAQGLWCFPKPFAAERHCFTFEKITFENL